MMYVPFPNSMLQGYLHHIGTCYLEIGRKYNILGTSINTTGAGAAPYMVTIVYLPFRFSATLQPIMSQFISKLNLLYLDYEPLLQGLQKMW